MGLSGLTSGKKGQRLIWFGVANNLDIINSANQILFHRQTTSGSLTLTPRYKFRFSVPLFLSCSQSDLELTSLTQTNSLQLPFAILRIHFKSTTFTPIMPSVMDTFSDDESWDEIARQVPIPAISDNANLWDDDEGWDAAAIEATKNMDFDDDEEFNGNGKRLYDRRENVVVKRLQKGKGISCSEIDPKLNFDLVREFQPRNINKFQCQVFKKVYKTSHNLKDVDILFVGNKIDQIFIDFLKEGMDQANDHDQVSVAISSPNLRKPIFVSYKKINFDHKEIVNKMAEIVQSESGESFILTGEFEIEIAVTRRISGGKGNLNSKRRAPREVSERSHAKRSVTVINNEDNACGYWAIALARFKARQPSESEWKVYKNESNEPNRSSCP